MEHSAGAGGGFLGVVFGNVLGIITFGSLLECVVMSVVGAVTGYLVIKFAKWVDKKIRKR